MAEAHNVDDDPFAKFSDGDDDTHTDTFVSMEDYNSGPSLTGGLNNNVTTHSQQSTMAGIEVDEIGDNELLRAVVDAASSGTPQELVSFPYDFGTPPVPADDSSNHEATSSNDLPTPLSSVRFADESSHPILDSMMSALDDGDEELNISDVNTTPHVIRHQFDAIESVRGGDPVSGNVAPPLSDAVTSSTIPNFFKMSRPYNAIADPNGSDTNLVLFSRIGPAGEEEVDALRTIAGEDKNPLSRIVEMMAYTVEFQTHELYKLKSADLDIFDKYVGESQARWTEADRRRSLTIKELLAELDRKGAHINKLEKRLDESTRAVRKERQFNEEFRAQCERLDPSIRFEDGARKAFTALNNVLYKSRRRSEATVQKQKMEIEEYAEKLLKLERQLNESQQRQSTLMKENTSLRVELASHANSQDCNHSALETPAVHCKTESHHHIDFSLLEEEKKLLAAESEELRRELRAARDEKVAIEDKLFSSNIESEELHRKLKSMKSQLSESEANIKLLKQSQAYLEEHSRKVAKELSQNTVDAAMELDKKDIEIRQLRFELDDRETAIKTYRSQIRELEKQISATTEEAISRGQSMASGVPRPISVTMDSAVETLQKEIQEARELLNEKHEEVDILKVSLAEMERNARLAEEECELWKTSAQSNTFEHRLEEEEVTLRDNQNDDFLRRLSVQLNCRAENKRDLIQKLVERIEALISERVALEEAREKLSGRIVEREKMIHAIRSEYETEISALKVQLQQLEHSRDRALNDRAAAEAKLDEIAKGADDSEFDFTLDMTNDLSMFDENRDGDEMDWKDPTINAAVKSVRHLVGTKMDLASRCESLNAKLRKLLNSEGGVSGESLSRDYLMETRDFNEELVSIIGQQQNTIKRLRSYTSRRLSFPDGRSEVNDDDPSISFSINEDDTMTYTQDFTQTMEDGTRQSKASAFLRQQLEEVRAQYTEKMNDNTKLSNVLKEMEQKLDSLMSEKTSTDGKLAALEELHNKFVMSLSHLLKVRTTTVVVESAVRDLVNHSKVMETKNMEVRTLAKRQVIRIVKLGAQKRVFEHILGLYIRKYSLNILAPLPKTQQSPLARFRAAAKAVIATKRMKFLVSRRDPEHLPFEYIDVTKSFNLPVQFRIADTRYGSIPLKSAVQAIQSSDKLQEAIADREKQIAELRRMLATLNTSVPSSEYLDAAQSSGFDYSQELVERKNEIALRLKKVLQEKEELEVRLTHEKQHRASSEVRANKYLEKASKLHTKLQTLKLTAENRERTYKAAIRYLKQKADSAIDVDFENAEPNQMVPEPTSDASPSDKQSKHNHIQILSAQLEQAMERLAHLEKGTKEYKDCKHYVLGLRSAMKRFKRMGKGSVQSVAASSQVGVNTMATIHEESSARVEASAL